MCSVNDSLISSSSVDWYQGHKGTQLKDITAISLDKGCCAEQAISPCSGPTWCTLRGFRLEKKSILALNSQKNNFNKPRLLHFPIHRKALTEKAVAPHSSPLAWKIPGTEEPGSCSPWSRWGSGTTERLHFHSSLWCIGEGNGNPLQCSCLEDPRDEVAWWAAVHGVAQSRARLSALAAAVVEKH